MSTCFLYSMMKSSSQKLFVSAIILCIATFATAQADALPARKPAAIESNAAKPYKVLTAGKRITVQSKSEINKIMVWTATGHRFVEENNVKSPSYSFTVNGNEKLFYIMLELKDGKRYTEKIGVQ